MAIRRVGIISKPKKEDVQAVVPELLDWLKQHGLEVVYDRETANAIAAPETGVPREQIPQDAELLIVLGGDGTLLATARLVEGRPTPILAVNLGSLGFLTEVTLGDLYSLLELFLAGKASLDTRKMLQVELKRNDKSVARYRALNDAVLNKAALARIMDFDVSVDGEFIARFKADGLVISTPTGSTAYSLAAGGPILYPAVDAFVITPICPHTLTNRPLVIPDTCRVDVVVEARGDVAYLTVDGQVGVDVRGEDRISVTRSESVINLIRPPKRGYFEVLRSKLRWGGR
jgi:NAD+ kinase